MKGKDSTSFDSEDSKETTRSRVSDGSSPQLPEFAGLLDHGLCPLSPPYSSARSFDSTVDTGDVAELDRLQWRAEIAHRQARRLEQHQDKHSIGFSLSRRIQGLVCRRRAPTEGNNIGVAVGATDAKKAQSKRLNSSAFSSVGSRAASRAPEWRVRLEDNKGTDPRRRQLQFQSYDRGNLMLKLCSWLASRSIDVVGAEFITEFGIVKNVFDLKAKDFDEFSDPDEWCEDFEEHITRGTFSVDDIQEFDGSELQITSLTLVSELPGPPEEFRYVIEIQSMNQVGMLAAAVGVLAGAGFNIVRGKAAMHQAPGSSTLVYETVEVATNSRESEVILRTKLAHVPKTVVLPPPSRGFD